MIVRRKFPIIVDALLSSLHCYWITVHVQQDLARWPVQPLELVSWDPRWRSFMVDHLFYGDRAGITICRKERNIPANRTVKISFPAIN